MSFQKYLAFLNSIKCILALFCVEYTVIIHSYQLVTLVAVLGEPLVALVAVR